MSNIKKSFIITIFIIFITIIFMLTATGVYLNIQALKYKNKVYPNIYLSHKKIDGYNYNDLKKKLDETEVDKNIIIMYNDKKIDTKYKDLGIKIDSKKTISSIKNSINQLSINNKIFLLMDVKKENVNYIYKIEENKIISCSNVHTMKIFKLYENNLKENDSFNINDNIFIKKRSFSLKKRNQV